ncbi:MAG: hypothetical protein WCR29_06130 [Bacteroidales bacterium]|nr:hypothetical protein [Bacteroidales bacterium]
MKKSIKAIILLFFLFLNFESFSQFVKLENYNFINYKDNKIEFFGSSEKKFTPLFEKIKHTIALGTDQVRVLHIGDKQTLDNVFVSQIYYNLSLTLDGLESRRGMLWNETTTLKPNKEIEYQVTDYNKKGDLLCKRFRLYHSPLNDSISIYINDIESSYKTIYFEDKGYSVFEITNPINTVNLKIINNSSENFIIYGHYLESKNAGFIYDIISGNRIISDIDILEKRYQNLLKTISFDMVVISLGEDAAYSPSYFSDSFKQDIKGLLKRLRLINPNIPILLTTPHDYYVNNKPNNRLELATQDLIEIAKTSNCAIWNFYKIMGSKGSSENWRRNSLMDNKKTTLTDKGSVFQGELYYNALWQSFENYISKTN